MWEMFLAHVVKLNPSHFAPSPLFLGRPRGRGGHDGTPIVHWWITWPPSLPSGRSQIPRLFPPGSPGSPPQTLITIPLSVTTRPNHCRQCLHQTTSKAGFLAARNDGCHSAEVHDPAKIEPFVRKESFVRIFSQIEPFSEIESNYHAHLLS